MNAIGPLVAQRPMKPISSPPNAPRTTTLPGLIILRGKLLNEFAADANFWDYNLPTCLVKPPLELDLTIFDGVAYEYMSMGEMKMHMNASGTGASWTNRPQGIPLKPANVKTEEQQMTNLVKAQAFIRKDLSTTTLLGFVPAFLVEGQSVTDSCQLFVNTF